MNDWEFIERPTAYVAGGHVTHFIFSVIDVHQGRDLANDDQGSKIVVVRFKGEGSTGLVQATVAPTRSRTRQS